MRHPIFVDQQRRPFAVTFERLGELWKTTVSAVDETAAGREALNLLAYARYTELRDRLGVLTREREWHILNVSKIS